MGKKSICNHNNEKLERFSHNFRRNTFEILPNSGIQQFSCAAKWKKKSELLVKKILRKHRQWLNIIGNIDSK